MNDLCKSVFNYLCKNKVAGGRVYPYIMPQNSSLPSVVYSIVSTKHDRALIKDTGFVRQTLQFNCYDNSFAKVVELSKKMRHLLQDYSGKMGEIEIEATFIITDMVTLREALNKSEKEVYCGVLEIAFHYNEEVK